MNRTSVLASLLIGLLVSGDLANAKCVVIPVRVQGDVVGQIQEGDELLLRFVYSPKRVESSSPQPVKDKAFTLVGAYSTYKRSDISMGTSATQPRVRFSLLCETRMAQFWILWT
jgi:hypothetical protein